MNENETVSWYPLHTARIYWSFFWGCMLLVGVGFPGTLRGQGDVLILYALDQDWAALEKLGAPIGKPIRIGSKVIHQVSLGTRRVRGLKLGSGLIESTLAAATALTRQPAGVIVTLGPVGALSDDLMPGDWVEVGAFVRYGSGTWTADGFRLNKENEPIERGVPATGAGAISKSMSQALLPKDARPGSRLGILAASGDAFVQSDSRRSELRQTTKAQVVEMNLAGIEVVARSFAISSLHWRVVSDRADQQALEDFSKFAKEYDGRGGKALGEAILRLPKDVRAATSYPALQRLLKSPGTQQAPVAEPPNVSPTPLSR